MNEEQLKKLIEAINYSTATIIESVVNGKIKRIDEKLSEYIHGDIKWKEEKVEPLIEAHSTIKNAAVFIKWAAGTVVATGILIKLFILEKI